MIIIVMPDPEHQQEPPRPTRDRAQSPPVVLALLPYVAPLAAYLLLLIPWLYAGAGAAQRDFFRAAASVIPTLLLTLAVQVRYFAPAVEVFEFSPGDRWRRLEQRLLVKFYATQVLLTL